MLQYILNEEGRARPVAELGVTDFVYDYFVKDHLGNVRSTITAKPMSMQYLAEHEIAAANIEQLVFDNIPNVRDGRPGGISGSNTMAARLDGGDSKRRIGTAVLLKVMAGDRFDISVDAYYEGEVPEQQVSGTDILSSLMSALSGGINYDGIPLSELPDNIKKVQTILSNPALAGQLAELQAEDDPAAPKAHLNYLFFDERLNLVSGAGGSTQVPMGTTNWATLTPVSNAIGSSTAIAAPEPGYILVYIDNATIGKDVWFDHLMIGHHTSEVIEENHYYPYGLTLQSSANSNINENRYLYNGIGLTKELNLEMYDAFYRDLDPQTGRFWQIDPKQNYLLSPYSIMNDNPIKYTDYLGDTTSYFRDGETSPWFTINNKGENTVTILHKGSEGVAILKYLLGMATSSSEDDMAKVVNSYGNEYDLKSFADFYDNYTNKFEADYVEDVDIRNVNDFIVDGKKVKKLYSEAGVMLVNNNGRISAGKRAGTSRIFNKIWDTDLPSEKNSTGRMLHIHPEGQEIGIYNGVGGYQIVRPAEYQNGGPSNTDYDHYSPYKENDVREVMVTKKNIYLYNRTKSQTIIIPR